jgi:transcription antitermination factor NusG
MRKVTWPDREQLKDTTIKIIIFVLFIGACSESWTCCFSSFWWRASHRYSRDVIVEHRWYAIQTTSGHENKVKSLICPEDRRDPRSPEERPIRQALVPTQEVVEIKNGKKGNVEAEDLSGLRPRRNGDWTRVTAQHDQRFRRDSSFVGPTSSMPQASAEEVNRLLGVADDSEAGRSEERFLSWWVRPSPLPKGVYGLQLGQRGSAVDKGKVRFSVFPLWTAYLVESITAAQRVLSGRTPYRPSVPGLPFQKRFKYLEGCFRAAATDPGRGWWPLRGAAVRRVGTRRIPLRR